MRGGWTEGKILRYLKATPSLHGVRAASRLIAEFASPEELKEHMFYHGTKASVSGLSPSITKSEEWAERHGGGGYGTRYWGVSVSKSKRVASSFGGHSPGVSIYPVVLAKGAKVVDRADLADADDVSDHIVELWNDGVDAVRLGDWKEDFSEQELLILNPRAICNVGTPDYYRQFRLWSPENPLNIKDDAQIAEVYEAAREYAGYSPFARFGKPTPPKMFENGELKPKEVRDAERAQYEKELEAWRSSEQGRAAEAYESNARNVIRFDSPELAPEARAREIASFTQRYYSRQRGLQRLAKPSADDFMDAAEGRWAKFRRIVQDKNLVIREVEERLGVTDKRESVYYAKDREFGLNEYQLGELQKRRVDPILDRLAETGASQRDFDLYLIARHAPYRNAVLRERGVTDGAGMGDAEAAEVIEGFNRLGVGDEFAAIADMVYAMNDEALQRRVDSGRVSPEEAETLRRTLVDYVPLRTDMENDERDAHNTYSSGRHQSEFRTAHGRRTLADSPLAWSIVQAERSIRDANANRVRQTAAALVRKSAALGKPIGEIIPGTQVRRRWAFNIGGEVLTLEELRDRTDLIFFKGDRRLRKNYSDNLPDSWNGRANTPDVYKWISQGLNAISGGSRFRKGAFDTSPENWQLLAETVLGGALADLNRAVSTVNDARLAALGAKPEQVLRDVPFVRDTLTNLPDVSSRYYDVLSDYEADRTEYSGLARTDAGKAEAFATSHPWAVGSENPVVGIVWKLGRAVQEAETPSEAAKLRREQLAEMAGFVRRMEEARKAGKRKEK